MASIKNLKKDINYILGDLIDEVMSKSDPKKADKIVDEIIETFDDLIAKVNQKKVENVKAHLKSVQDELANKYEAISVKIAAL